MKVIKFEHPDTDGVWLREDAVRRLSEHAVGGLNQIKSECQAQLPFWDELPADLRHVIARFLQTVGEAVLRDVSVTETHDQSDELETTF